MFAKTHGTGTTKGILTVCKLKKKKIKQEVRESAGVNNHMSFNLIKIQKLMEKPFTFLPHREAL